MGHDAWADAFHGVDSLEYADESFVYCSKGDDILIYGGRQRGTMYGVYSFLEEQIGTRWYTTAFTHIPHVTRIVIPDSLSVCQHPAIPYRYDYCYESVRDEIWCAHNRLNMQEKPVHNAFGDIDAYWGAHTFRKLLPQEEYFKSHPEYFSLRDGKRISDGQLCLSNPAVLPLVTERLLRYIKASPDCWGYDVSQNDNKLYCECKKCSKIAKKYGGQSGLMIWFVNQVAKSIEEKYPDKYIGTFAYEYTRQPPKGIRPRQNVLIRLCDIECCFAHPLDKCELNKAFIADLRAWAELTDNLFIWDYLVNFHYYHLPFPNHHAIARNIETFRQYNVKGVLELGAYDARWSEFSEMRQWLTGHLLWNPTLDTDSLASLFINDYYGKASSDIWQYYQAICALPASNTHIQCHSDPDTVLYNSSFRKRSIQLLQHAESIARKTGDAVILQRVRRVLVQAYFLRSELDGMEAVTDGTILRLKQIIEEDPTIIRERGLTIQRYLMHHGYI